MKKYLLAAAALSTSLLATAAMAQVPPPPGWHGGWDREAFWRGAPANPLDRIQFLRNRIDQGLANGSLDHHEFARVSGELNSVLGWIHEKHWEDAGRLTPEQNATVQARLDQISQQIRWLQRNGW